MEYPILYDINYCMGMRARGAKRVAYQEPFYGQAINRWFHKKKREIKTVLSSAQLN